MVDVPNCGLCANRTRLWSRDQPGDRTRTGVTANAICPGPFETEMNRVLTEDPDTKEAFAAHTAMRRWGRMEEIETAVLFLAAETSGYVTGAMIPVDGGWTAQ
ncbi:MAG TPA: hypothetical protein DDZ51_19475 [Planctomycetaceae bacterium]|jgi:NAD(P)-dependent dehydrogenase (short-subunit alcohol dehydrogenase family)|nr:hypothetical protein [Planctomycetaceae bacterium]